MKIYLAGPLFSTAERDFNARLARYKNLDVVDASQQHSDAVSRERLIVHNHGAYFRGHGCAPAAGLNGMFSVTTVPPAGAGVRIKRPAAP